MVKCVCVCVCVRLPTEPQSVQCSCPFRCFADLQFRCSDLSVFSKCMYYLCGICTFVWEHYYDYYFSDSSSPSSSTTAAEAAAEVTCHRLSTWQSVQCSVFSEFVYVCVRHRKTSGQLPAGKWASSDKIWATKIGFVLPLPFCCCCCCCFTWPS